MFSWSQVNKELHPGGKPVWRQRVWLCFGLMGLSGCRLALSSSMVLGIVSSGFTARKRLQ